MVREEEHDDENISIIHGEEPWEYSEKKHTDTKNKIKAIILEMEEHCLMFKREEIVEHAKHNKIPEAETNAVIDDLLEEGYLHYVVGTEKLLSRTAWRDYSPANEELFDF